jgi:Transcriptional regulators
MKNLDDKFEELFQLYKQLEKYIDGIPRHYNGILLYPSEIHLLAFIAENQELNVTELAEKRNVSKGALSKILGKLIEKGLIEKYGKKGNSKNIYFSLTKYGTKAYEGHMEFHSEHDRKHSKEMIDFLNTNRDVLEKAMDFAKLEIQEYINELLQEGQNS